MENKIKDLEWCISENIYVIRNVPYFITDSEEFLDLNISILVTSLRDLMVFDLIPDEVDLNDFLDIEF